MSGDGVTAISGSCGRLLVHSVADGSVLKEIDAHEDWINSLAFSRDGTKLATGSNDRMCRVWDVGEWTVLKEIEHPAPVISVQFADDVIEWMKSSLLGLVANLLA